MEEEDGMNHAFNCMNPLCFVYAENASCAGVSWEPLGNDMEVMFPVSSYGTGEKEKKKQPPTW